MKLPVECDIMVKKKVSLLVLSIKIKYILIVNKNKKKGCKNMVTDEEYKTFLKNIIACISHGDYYSVKELSQLELKKIEEKEKENQKKEPKNWWGLSKK